MGHITKRYDVQIGFDTIDVSISYLVQKKVVTIMVINDTRMQLKPTSSSC